MDMGPAHAGNGTTLLVLLRKVKDWPFHDGLCETSLFLDGLGDYKIITSFESLGLVFESLPKGRRLDNTTMIFLFVQMDTTYALLELTFFVRVKPDMPFIGDTITRFFFLLFDATLPV